MLSNRKKVRIISLGEIVTLDIMKTLHAFTALIAEKIQSNNLGEIGKKIGGVLQQKVNLINEFKLGKVSEVEFTSQMIVVLEESTGAKITVEEFDNPGANEPILQSNFRPVKSSIDITINLINRLSLLALLIPKIYAALQTS